MLRASPPDDGADADGRFDVDSVLVTEFLLSFVGTLAGRNDSSDIVRNRVSEHSWFGDISMRGACRRRSAGSQRDDG